jgi:hypothetical protein
MNSKIRIQDDINMRKPRKMVISEVELSMVGVASRW